MTDTEQGEQTSTELVQAAQNVVVALNNLAEVMGGAFPGANGSVSGSASAGAATLPANPVGFITVVLPDGSEGKVPYYGA